jgi:hypothetical protein
VHDPADHAPVIGALDTSHILRQMRFNPCPLLVAQPEQISAHRFFPNTNQYRIVQTEKLMSSDPSTADPKSLRHKRRIRSGTSDRQSGTRINKFASAHDFPKFVKVGAAMEHELRKVGTRPAAGTIM